MGTELVGDRLSRGTNQLGTNCGGPNVREPYVFGTKCVTAAISINIKQIQIDGKMDTVHLQKQLQMYIRTKGLSVIARLHCIGIITHNVIKKCLKLQLIWVWSKMLNV